MRTSHTLVCFLSAILSQAQSWCPPGATWTYGTDAFGLYGYHQYTYVGDTMLGGLQAQRLSGQGAMSNYFAPGQVDYWSSPLAFITAVDGDVILNWDQTGLGWDTLFWLGAEPGDGWLRGAGEYGPCDPPDSLVIIDTATTIVDGMALRQWQVEQRWSGGSFSSLLVFTERLGWNWSFLPYPGCLIVDGPIGMRCYSDDDISVQFGAFGCTSLVGFDEQSAIAGPVLYPNPGETGFSMNLPLGIHQTEIMDAAGRSVLRTTLHGGLSHIDTSQLGAGIYMVRVDQSVPSRWVKHE